MVTWLNRWMQAEEEEKVGGRGEGEGEGEGKGEGEGEGEGERKRKEEMEEEEERESIKDLGAPGAIPGGMLRSREGGSGWVVLWEGKRGRQRTRRQ